MRITILIVLLLLGQVIHAGTFRVKKIVKDFDKVVPMAMRASTIAAEMIKLQPIVEKPIEELKEVIK